MANSKNGSEMVSNTLMKSDTKSDGQQVSVGATLSLAKTLEDLDLDDIAVQIKNVNFSYNSCGLLLDNFTMTFLRSSIYGFLGPSGCGKTTLIKIITGLLKPSRGIVLVNGKKPRDKLNRIPGPGIGYMSQENCLLEEFSIEETFTYFSQIYGLNKDYMNKRIEFLMDFLDLPDKTRKVSNLSGGQQRRTSLGVAIIHNPPILILDEPTVGVDPLLREKIWLHLLELCAKEKTSIMITTHYIDECRRAHVIGLMRNGKLLAESSPNLLLTHFKTKSLEDVFLRLCRTEEQKLFGVEVLPNLDQIRTQLCAKKKTKPFKAINQTQCHPNGSKRFCALFKKYFLIVCGNKTTLFMEIFIPMIILTLFAICIGKKVFDLDVALFSGERRNTSVDKSQKLSEMFIDKIDKKTINLIEYDSKESALQSVRSGKTYGALYVDSHFSSALIQRTKTLNMSDEVLFQNTLYFDGDLSDLNIFMVLFRTLLESMVKFMVQMIEKTASNMTDSETKPNPKAVKPLIEIRDPPLYGDKDPLFSEFLLPGIMVTIAFMMASALTSLNIIEERRRGLLERTVVAGAQIYEILLSMLSVHLLVVVIQSIITITTVYIVFEFKNEGNYLITTSLLILQSICGMSLGLLVSSIASDTKMALVIAVAIIIPFLLISGIIWPLEGMEWPFMRNMSLLLPQTMAIKALRVVTHKGWGLNRVYVWWGYIIPIVWSVIFISASTVINQFRTD